MTNGRLDISTLVKVDGWALLSPRTAQKYLGVKAELRRRGQPEMEITQPDGAYRTYDRQVYWKAYWTARGLPLNAATPGFSNHGEAEAWDILNVVIFHKPTLLEVLALFGLVCDVSTEPWHVHDAGAPITFAGAGAASPITEQKPKGDITMYLTRNEQGIFINTEIGAAHLTQVSHADLFLRVLNNPNPGDTFNSAQTDIMSVYKDQANARVNDATLAAIRAIKPFDSAAAATSIANTLKAMGIVIDYTKVATAVDTQLADNFAAVDAQSKAASSDVLAAVTKIGTIDTASVTAAVEKAVAAAGITIDAAAAGTIAGAVRAAIAPDLVKLELKNQLK